MRYFLTWILIFNSLFAHGQASRVVNGGVFPNANAEKNYIKNFGAESNVLDLTASTHSITRSTTTPIFDTADFSITASGAGSVYWNLYTFDQGLKNNNCEFKGIYEGGGDTWTAVVRSGSTEIATLSLPSSTSPRPFSLNAPCGDISTTYTVGFKTTASAGSFNVDNLYFGLATNIGSVDVTTSWQSYTPSNTQGFGTISAVNLLYRINKGNLEIQGGFTSGTVTASTAQLELPTGYTISGTTSARIYVGEMIRNGGSRVTVLGVQGRTYLTFGAGASSQGDVAGSSLVSSSEALLLTSISVPISQSPPQQIISQAAQGWFVAANIAGANPSLGGADLTSYTEIANGSLTMTPVSGSQPVGIMCSSTNAAATPTTSTSTCSAGNESVGANFSIPAVGWYEVCLQAGVLLSTSVGSSIDATFELIETPTNAQTTTQEGKARVNFANSVASSNSVYPLNLCGSFYFSSIGIKGVRLMGEQDITGTTDTQIKADGSTNLGQRDILITVKPVTNGMPSPFLVGSVQYDTTVKANGFNGVNSVIYNTFTPTLTNTTNIASSTPQLSSYFCIGNHCHVSGYFDVTCTAGAGTSSTLKISLPIASAMTLITDLNGVVGSSSLTQTGAIFADTTNDVAQVTWLCQSTGAQAIRYSFDYLVK